MRASSLLFALLFSATLFLPAEGGAMASRKHVPKARTATLLWEAPTTFEDGSPLKDLAGYKIYCGRASRKYDRDRTVILPLDSPDLTCKQTEGVQGRKAGMLCTYTLRGLSPDPLYFSVSAYTKNGKESGLSEELKK